jgi:alkaline phosphatase
MKRLIQSIFFLIAFAATTFAQGNAKYVFYFIGDGMGVNQVNGTEMYLAETQDGRIGVKPLLFTQFPVCTVATTFSATNSVTDSAAAGTALSTGTKTYNSAIGLDANKERLTTVAEMAKRSGKKVGVTTTVSVDHATPAAFYAHQPSRSMYYEIATDLPKAGFDFYGGSGFLRPETNYKKEKAPNIFPMFEKAGYTIARGYNDFKAKEAGAKKMILIQDEKANPKSLPYAIDRKDGDLTLAQITESAISFLSKDNKKGFFLMVEGGKIDWACHDNDAATAFNEVVDMDNAVKVAYEFYKKHPKETLIVITADHETGGIALGRGKYVLNLKALASQKQSADELSNRINALHQRNKNASWEEVKELLSETMGFWREVPVDWKYEKALRDEYEATFGASNAAANKSLYSETHPLAAKAKEVLDKIACISWASGGHSAGYTPVYAIGAGSQLFEGKLDNTDIPKRILKAAGYK